MAVNRSSRAPATRSTGIVEAGQAVPQRVLRTGAGEAQARREPFDGVLAPLVVVPRGGREGREERLREPAFEEHVEAVALERTRELLVPLDACRALGLVLDAGSAADEDQSLDPIGVGEGDVEDHPGAHRIADVRARGGVRQQVGGLPEVGAHG